MEDHFVNCADHGSMKKTNLVGEDDDPGALRDGGKDCRVDDEALDLDDSWLMRENEHSNGVRYDCSDVLRKSYDGGDAEVI
ncbi:uncharacterized protein HKW66_Vig0125110 [Vigna angularis]|uniref:Uncharacterized protein n=1 Tax=Phaseolus angularis TaxID=3914 RepID=A0A8T0K443_PHAAN|nr:uncharacterized protein HKW66_Vig0125110 [Vigna angularis]